MKTFCNKLLVRLIKIILKCLVSVIMRDKCSTGHTMKILLFIMTLVFLSACMYWCQFLKPYKILPQYVEQQLLVTKTIHKLVTRSSHKLFTNCSETIQKLYINYTPTKHKLHSPHLPARHPSQQSAIYYISSSSYSSSSSSYI